MKLIDRINDSAIQKITLLTEDTGERITCTLRYMPTQLSWIMDIIYGDFVLNGVSVVSGLNILRNYKNILPFGVSITTTDGFDPYYLQDFQSGRAKFYLLSQSDVESVEASINEV